MLGVHYLETHLNRCCDTVLTGIRFLDLTQGLPSLVGCEVAVDSIRRVLALESIRSCAVDVGNVIETRPRFEMVPTQAFCRVKDHSWWFWGSSLVKRPPDE